MNADVRLFIAFAMSKAIVAVSGVAIAATLSRLLGPEVFGEWTLVAAAAAFLHVGFINWTHGATVRFGREEWELDRSLSRTFSARLPLVAASIGLVLIAVVGQPFGWLAEGFGLERSAAGLVIALAVGLWLTAEAQAACQATDRLGLQSVLGPAAAVAAIAAVVALEGLGRADLFTAVAAVAISASAVWGGGLVWVLARARLRLRVPERAELMRYLSYGAPLWLSFLIGYVSDWGDHLILRRYGSLRELGEFGLAYQMFLALLAANGVLSTILLPRLIAAHARSASASGRFVITVVPTILTLWVIVTIATVAVAPLLMAAVVGPGFDTATASLLILCVVVPSSAITAMYSALFSLQERLGRALAFIAGMTAVNLAISLVLVPLLGAVGAAIGTAASHAIGQYAYIRDQHLFYRVPTRSVMAVWLVGTGCGLAQFFAGTGIGWRVLWAMGAGGAVVWIARQTKAIDADLLDRLLAGPMQPLSLVVRRAFGLDKAHRPAG